MFTYIQKVLCLITLLLLTSCATKEEIRRRELLKQLSQEMSSSQDTTTNIIDRIAAMEENLSTVQGAIEKSTFQKDIDNKIRDQKLDAEVTLLKEDVESLKTQMGESKKILEEIQAKLSSQEKFIKDVVKTLSQMSSGKTVIRKGKKGGSRKKVSKYDTAMANYRSGKYKTAKRDLIVLVDSKSIKGKKKARIVHNLGMIEYMNKQYNKATIYFSRLYTEWPKVSYNANGLFYLAKSFESLKKNDEAKQTLNELIKNFPKSSSAKKAKKLLKKL